MSLTLHAFSGAPPGWRVMLGLAFKGLDYHLNTLSNAHQDQKKPAFLALSPRGLAPVLEAEGQVLRDSVAILAWLDRAYSQRPLFGETVAEAAAIWTLVQEASEHLRKATHEVLSRVFPHADAADDPLRGERRVAAETLCHEWQLLEDILGDGRAYFAGPSPSAADAVIYPEIRLVQRGLETKPALMQAAGMGEIFIRFPHLSSWLYRLANDPEIAATTPPHWAENF